MKTKVLKTLNELELDAIESRLEWHKGSVTKTAKSLGLNRVTLYRRINKYSIDVKSYRQLCANS